VVTVYDPEAMGNARALFPTLGFADSVVEACERADVVLLLTEWDEGSPVTAADWAEESVIRRLLSDAATWAVVGLSDSRLRPAYGVAATLQRHGKRIVPVHPRAVTVHGENGYRTLAEIPFPIDVVDLFVNSTRVGAVVDQAIAAGAGAVWLQLGVTDEAAVERAHAAGLDVVMNRCPAIEGPRLLGW
jgi:predicted CoA-binding protein